MIKKVKRRILGKIAKKLAKYNIEKVAQQPAVSHEVLRHNTNALLLKGKVALVLGASSGIGKACAISLAQNGAKVVIAARRKDLLQNVCDQINQEYNGNCKYIVCDVLQIEQIKKAVDFTVEQFGHLDIAVNNAGVEQTIHDILNVTEKEVNHVMDTNIKYVIYACKYQILAMKDNKRPSSIINISSIMGGRVAIPVQNIYSLSKAAVESLTKTLSVQYNETNIRINAIAPGTTKTDMISRVCGNNDFCNIMPQDIANAVVFLASDNSTFINGASIPVDGGFICD